MDTQTMEYLNNEALISNKKKEWTTITCESQKCAEKNKPDTRIHTL